MPPKQQLRIILFPAAVRRMARLLQREYFFQLYQLCCYTDARQRTLTLTFNG